MSPSLLPQRAPARVLEPVVRVLVALHITPAMVTVAGVIGSGTAALLIANGALVAGGIVVLVAGALDMFDGALARSTGRATPFGALFDSTLDRYSEAIVLFGLLWYELDQGHREESLLVFVALAGSMMVSYVRARGEGLGVSVHAGLFQRPERIVVLGLALITGLVRAGLWVLAVATVLTSLHRLVVAGRALMTRDEGDAE